MKNSENWLIITKCGREMRIVEYSTGKFKYLPPDTKDIIKVTKVYSSRETIEMLLVVS